MLCILNQGLFEELDVFFKFSPFLKKAVLSVDLFNLFRLEVLFVLQLSYFSQFFIDIPDFLVESSKGRLVLLIYNLKFVLLRPFGLWLRLLLH